MTSTRLVSVINTLLGHYLIFILDLNLIRESSVPQAKFKLLENAIDSDWYPWPNKKVCNPA